MESDFQDSNSIRTHTEVSIGKGFQVQIKEEQKTVFNRFSS